MEGLDEMTSFRECFIIDFREWYPDFRVRDYIRHFFFDSGYFAVVCYRLARYFQHRKYTPLKKGIPFLPSFFFRLAIAKSGCEISYNADIGKGLIVDHSVGIVIGGGVKMGKMVKVFSGVTIGGRNLEKYESTAEKRYPSIGDNVVIFSGAKILGPVTIGDGATIGANSVVIDSVPADATAAGIPAKVITAGG